MWHTFLEWQYSARLGKYGQKLFWGFCGTECLKHGRAESTERAELIWCPWMVSKNLDGIFFFGFCGTECLKHGRAESAEPAE